MEPKPEFAEDEVKGLLESIASTGKFWLDWDKLKSMLSFQLKQVLSEYPEAKMTTEQQNASLGGTFEDLVKRLDEELHAFIEGPPFTLQRICEILLAARSIYPNLSKLALALEKNLLVTSTITACSDPYPQTTIPNPSEQDKASEELQPPLPPLPPPQSESIQNGVEPTVDRDEIMTEVEETEIDHDMSIDMDSFQEMVESSETNSTPAGNS
ncbi:hypothetical protein SLE2022_149470 [Rubroshorea leprosula]